MAHTRNDKHRYSWGNVGYGDAMPTGQVVSVKGPGKSKGCVPFSDDTRQLSKGTLIHDPVEFKWLDLWWLCNMDQDNYYSYQPFKFSRPLSPILFALCEKEIKHYH